MSSCRWLFASASLALAASAFAADLPPLAKGERIVFLGDSITQAGAGPKGYVTMIRETLASRHPELAIECLGAGISGNKVPDLQRRVDKDVIARKPTLVLIYIGINDVWHGEKDPARGTTPDNFVAGLREVIGKITQAGARVVLCTPSVIGEKKSGENNLDAKLDEYAGLSRALATELKLPLCDLRQAFVDHLRANNPDNKASGILTSDRVHLNEAGNRFVAETMLKTIDRPAVESAWIDLFDGKTLTGWTQKNGTATYRVEDGTVIGKTAEGSPNSFLCTDRDYANFELTFEVKLLDGRLNSGVQIRSASKPDYNNGRVHGPQVEISTDGNAGFIYGEGLKTGWVTPEESRSNAAARAAYKATEWNKYRVVADGQSIKTWINDVPVTETTDDKTGHTTGFIGLQVHGIAKGAGPYEVQWRNIRLRTK